MPLALKDNLATRGVPTTCSSRILEGWRPPYDATVVTRVQAAGAVVVGKTNLDEFAMGSSTENSAFGPTRNPHDPTRVPGGSSGGSAAAVAAGFAPLALGSDTGGSIRQPAALCGVVGMKPTYGVVSRYGLVAFASSLDQIGPFARTVGDAALLLEVIAGHDPMDTTSLDRPAPRVVEHLDDGVDGLRVGIVRELMIEGIEADVRRRVEAAAEALAAAGAKVEEASVPAAAYGLSAYYLIAPAEASSNLARYDGVRYGLRVDAPTTGEMNAATRTAGFGAEVKRRIMLGTYALSAGYYDAYYGKAQAVRTLIIRDFAAAYGRFDLLLAPTTPSTAFELGAKTADPLSMYLSDVCTIPSNLAGHPAISVPYGVGRRRPADRRPAAGPGARRGPDVPRRRRARGLGRLNVRRRPGRRRLPPLIALALLGFVVLGAPDTSLGVAWPAVREDFGLPLSGLGVLLASYTVGLPAGRGGQRVPGRAGRDGPAPHRRRPHRRPRRHRLRRDPLVDRPHPRLRPDRGRQRRPRRRAQRPRGADPVPPGPQPAPRRLRRGGHPRATALRRPAGGGRLLAVGLRRDRRGRARHGRSPSGRPGTIGSPARAPVAAVVDAARGRPTAGSCPSASWCSSCTWGSRPVPGSGPTAR